MNAEVKESMMKRVSRIVVVDDHPLVRKGLAELICNEDDLDVCGEAAGTPEAIQLVGKEKPDLVIIDLTLKEGSGMELIQQIKAQYEETKILIASMHDEMLFAERSVRAGASGYINKEEATDKMVEAIRKVLSGKIYLSPRVAERIFDQIAGNEETAATDPIGALSNRELQVFELIGAGLATREVAERLHLSKKTIETYRENIKQKLNLETGNQLVQRAVQWVLEGRA
jgi:DNA-binding NarL/FixJ family response regulator